MTLSAPPPSASPSTSSPRSEDPEWENTTAQRGHPRDEIEALKSRPGKDIVTTGSITLVRSLIAAGLVDEYRLFVYPVVLGRGERLFADTPGSRSSARGDSAVPQQDRAAALPTA